MSERPASFEAPRVAPEWNTLVVTRWVEEQLHLTPGEFGPCSSVAVTIGNQIVAGVVLSDYREMERGKSLQASIASITPRWATRRVLHDLFVWPFRGLGVTRLWVGQPKNRQLRRFVERLGFVYEGTARRAWDGHRDMVVLSMLPHECRWLEEEHGKGQSAKAA